MSDAVPDRVSASPPDRPLVIESLAAGGAGVGRLESGMTVFVQRTAPGDQVRLLDLHPRRRYATARLAEILEAGPARVTPPCAHFVEDRCGGCQWQHLANEAQRAAKARVVGDALRRIGKLDVADPAVIASPRALGYRATISLTVRHTASRTIAGFHDYTDASRVFHLEKCWIARDEVDALWRAVRSALGELPRGDDVRLKLRVTTQGGRHVMVDGGDRAWSLEAAERVAAAARTGGAEVTVWWKPTGGAVRRMAGREADAGEVSFAQVNPEVAAMLREAVLTAADRPTGGPAVGKVLDLYAGVGDTAIPLAAGGDDVVMVERDERAVRLAEERAKQQGVSLRCIAAKVEDVLAGLLPADTVIANPPRTGLGDVVTDRLTAHPPARLLYVSCDPATLARDLARLVTAGMRVAGLTAFDMFPQTSHVETLAELEHAA